jgi:hypothetical protein
MTDDGFGLEIDGPMPVVWSLLCRQWWRAGLWGMVMERCWSLPPDESLGRMV